MNPQLVKLAQEAKLFPLDYKQNDAGSLLEKALDDFARLAIELERESNAQMCEDFPALQYPEKKDFTGKICASVIRSKNTKLHSQIAELVPEYSYNEKQRVQYASAVNLIVHSICEIIKLQITDKEQAQNLIEFIKVRHSDYK